SNSSNSPYSSAPTINMTSGTYLSVSTLFFPKSPLLSHLPLFFLYSPPQPPSAPIPELHLRRPRLARGRRGAAAGSLDGEVELRASSRSTVGGRPRVDALQEQQASSMSNLTAMASNWKAILLNRIAMESSARSMVVDASGTASVCGGGQGRPARRPRAAARGTREAPRGGRSELVRRRGKLAGPSAEEQAGAPSSCGGAAGSRRSGPVRRVLALPGRCVLQLARKERTDTTAE
ncbi:unnamed protein product, partial [Urochloa humidicola]